MITIHRYELDITDHQTIYMPKNAYVLHDPPNPRKSGIIEIWVKLDTTNEPEPRDFYIIGTGNPIPNYLQHYIGTVVTHDGQFVWHIFEDED